MKLSCKIYKDLYHKADELTNKLGIHLNIVIKGKRSKLMDGTATLSNSVVLTKPLLDLYKTEKQYVLDFMLAHELVHIKYQDSGFNRLLWSLIGGFGSNRGNALILLMEMRANVLANAILGLTEDEIEEAHVK